MKRRNRDNYKENYQTIFINQAELREEFDKSYDDDALTERAGALIMILTENIVFSSNFRLSDKPYEVTEALIDSVIMYIMENWSRLYVKDKNSNPFSYFTSVVRSRAYDFLRVRYGKKKRLDLYGKKLKYRDAKHKWCTAHTVEFTDTN